MSWSQKVLLPKEAKEKEQKEPVDPTIFQLTSNPHTNNNEIDEENEKNKFHSILLTSPFHFSKKKSISLSDFCSIAIKPVPLAGATSSTCLSLNPSTHGNYELNNKNNAISYLTSTKKNHVKPLVPLLPAIHNNETCKINVVPQNNFTATNTSCDQNDHSNRSTVDSNKTRFSTQQLLLTCTDVLTPGTDKNNNNNNHGN